MSAALKYKARLLLTQNVTHNVRRFVMSKPTGFSFKPGQAVEISICHPKWNDESRPFTPTSLNDDEVLEFIIKKYPEHNGVTEQLHCLEIGATFNLSEPFDSIQYKGPGVFIAGGAGITPFISILRDIDKNKQSKVDNILIFSNKTPRDLILGQELKLLTQGNLINVYTKESTNDGACQRIDKTFLIDTITSMNKPFYLCGPPGFVKDINNHLNEIGVDVNEVHFDA